MKVPVKIIIAENKSFEIKVGTPPVSALIKSELGLASGSSNTRTTKVGNLTVDQAKKIAEMKKYDLLGATVKARVLEVAGNCVCVGVTVDGKDPKVFQADVKAGMYDNVLR
jgi:large subunit ribosomal protein L11